MVCLIPCSQFWDVPSAQNILFLSKFKFILETHFNPVSPKSHWWGLLPSGPVSPSAEPPSPVHVATLWFILRLSCFLALLPVDLFLSFHSHGKSCLLPFCLCLHPIWHPQPIAGQGRLQTAAPTENLPEHLLTSAVEWEQCLDVCSPSGNRISVSHLLQELRADL